MWPNVTNAPSTLKLDKKSCDVDGTGEFMLHKQVSELPKYDYKILDGDKSNSQEALVAWLIVSQ